MSAFLGQGLGFGVELLDHPTHALFDRTSEHFFSDSAEPAARLGRWGALATAYGNGTVAAAYAPSRAALGANEPYVPEPFLYVHVAWGDGSESHWGEVDRPTGQFQIWGRLVDVGELPLLLSEEHLLQRVISSLTVEDLAGELGPRILDESWARARLTWFIGFPELARADYLQVSPPMRIDTPPEGAEGVFTLALIDALEDVTGFKFHLPEVRTMSDADSPTLRARLPADDTYHTTLPRYAANWDLQEQKRKIPVAFGREMSKVAWAFANPWLAPEVVANDKNWYAILVLGTSRKAGWMKSHDWGFTPEGFPLDQFGDKDVELWIGGRRGERYSAPRVLGTAISREVLENDAYFDPLPLLVLNRPGTFRVTTGMYIRIEVIKHFDPVPPPGADARPFTWHTAVMFVAFDANLYPSTTGLYDEDKEFLERIRKGDADGALLWRAPYGAEGRVFYELNRVGWNSDPVSVARIILRHFTDGNGTAIDDASFDDAATAPEINGRTVAGSIAGKEAPYELLSELASSWLFDLFLSRDGKVKCRPMGLTHRDLTVEIPGALLVTDEHDIVAGSWNTRPAWGDERWGRANTLRVSGLKPETVVAYPDLDESYEYDSPKNTALGRQVERGANISWREQWATTSPIVSDALQKFGEPFTVQRVLASFDTGLNVLVKERGQFLRVSHWAGIAEVAGQGWDQRLARIEGLTLKWQERTVGVEVVDFSEADSQRPWVLDSEIYWIRIRGLAGSLRGLRFSAGSATVETLGWACDTQPAITRPTIGDILWTPHAAAVGNRLAVKVIGVGEAKFDIAAPATANEDLWIWEVQRSHLTAPTNAEFPGAYPFGSDIYGRLCGADGLFSNGNPGYEIRE